METAQLDEVVQRGGTAVGPMVDVVSVQPPVLVAAGKAAALVAAAQRPAERGRDRARLATNRQGLAIALDDRDDRGVAAQPARGLDRQRGAAFELAAPAQVATGQRRRVDVNDDLVAIAAGAL